MPPVGGNSELFVDTWLTSLSFDYLQGERAAIYNKVFPTVPVQRESGKFIKFTREDFLRDQMRERPLGGRADVADWDKTEDTYRVVERALAHKVDDRQRANADSQLDLDRQAMRLLTNSVAVNNDRRWAEEFFGTGIWGTDLDGSTADFTQFDQSGSDPIGLIMEYRDQIEKTGVQDPNLVLVVGPQVNRTLLSNADIIDRIKYTQRGVPTEALIAEMLGIDRYLVAKNIFNSAGEGAAESIDYIFNEDDMLLVHAAPSPGLETASGGYTFAWTGLLNGAANAEGGVMMSGRDEFAHSDHFEIRTAVDFKLVAADLGVYFTDCTA